MKKKKSPRNRSLDLDKGERKKYLSKIIKLNKIATVENILNKTICQNLFSAVKYLPKDFVDLLIVDPPYNMNKVFKSTKFTMKSDEEYSDWVESFLLKLKPILKKNASIYFCADWNTSVSVAQILKKHFILRNRITWEREKGRGTDRNWKNSSEDIWFATVSDDYTFNASDVKLNRKVIAPYKDTNGEPRDWKKGKNGIYRMTFSSNIWTDISVPFWSMPENTEHPTQKPEKLIAKLILASSNKGDVVFDPFLGAGTTSVVAKKLDRNYVGIEIDKFYSCLTEKRLELADMNKKIQGYEYGKFWERNTSPIPIE